MDYKKELEKIKRFYLEEKGKKDNLGSIVEEEKKKVQKIETLLHDNGIEKEVILKATAKAREGSKNVIEEISTEALQMVLNTEKKALIEMSLKDGVPAATMMIVSGEKDEELKTNPANSNGGGLRDIISLSVLAAIRMLDNKNNKAPLFLDEPFKNLSKEYANQSSTFIKKLSNSIGTQMFIVTHEQDVLPNVADKTIEVTQVNGVSYIKER
ncbi:MAG: hypothetical protein RSC93_07795 [Erysipelotrichaceae bacterium]